SEWGRGRRSGIRATRRPDITPGEHTEHLRGRAVPESREIGEALRIAEGTEHLIEEGDVAVVVGVQAALVVHGVPLGTLNDVADEVRRLHVEVLEDRHQEGGE